MYKVTVMYPNRKDSLFDFDYYRTTHMALVHKYLKPFGLVKTEIERGYSGGSGLPAPYVCVGSLFFDSPDGYDRGMAEVGSILRRDVAKFTDIKPIRQLGEIID